jgi:molybdate transport system substrate-binding protein
MLFSGLLVCCALIPNFSYSGEIRVLSANVFTGVLDSQFRDFERSSGHTVGFIYDTAGRIKNRVQSGEMGEIAIATRPLMDELEKNGKIVQGTIANIARSTVAVVVRNGAVKPDVSSVEAFKRTLLAARTISYPDPTRGGATAVLFTDILEQLGIAAEMKPKTTFPSPGHFAVELVASGEVEVAIAQPMEALLQSGVEIAGPLPSELQKPLSFTFAAGEMAASKDPNAARSLILFLTGPAVQSAIMSKGMEPGQGR